MSFGPVGLDSGVPHGGLSMYVDRHPVMKTDTQLRTEDEQRMAELRAVATRENTTNVITDLVNRTSNLYTNVAHNDITSRVTNSGFFKCDVWSIIGCDKRPDWWPKPQYQRADFALNENNSTEERQAEAITGVTDAAFAGADLLTLGTATGAIAAARTGIRSGMKIASEKGGAAVVKAGAKTAMEASIEAGKRPIRATLKLGEVAGTIADVQAKIEAVRCEDDDVLGLNVTAAGVSNKFARAAGGCKSYDDWLPSEAPTESDDQPLPAPGPLERKMPQTTSGVKESVNLDAFVGEQPSPLVLPIVLVTLLITSYVVVRKF